MRPDYLPRLTASVLERDLTRFPVVVLTGARQTGKSTLVRALAAEDRPYLTLDDLAVLDQAERSPHDLLHRSPRLTLDEVQRVPELLLEIKRVIDEEGRRSGRFLLTGSANLLLMESVADSLAGRAVYRTLFPLTRGEQAGRGECGAWETLLGIELDGWRDALLARGGEREDWRALARRGGYPVPAHELDDQGARDAWLDGYVRTYLERDLQDLSSVQSLPDFRRLMRAAAHRLGGLLNQSELGRDVGLPQSTVHRYLNLLETSFQIVRLQPYSVNRTKRLIKAPKLYWMDAGLALHLSGVEPGGAHLENLVLTDLLAWAHARETARPEVLFWRTASGQEVDFVVESDGRLLAVEVKAGRSPSRSDARHLLAFRDEYRDAVHGCLLLHDGDEVFRMAEGVMAAPWWRVI